MDYPRPYEVLKFISPDGENSVIFYDYFEIYYGIYNAKVKAFDASGLQLNLDFGKTEAFVKYSKQFKSWAWSPDSRYFAYYSRDNSGGLKKITHLFAIIDFKEGKVWFEQIPFLAETIKWDNILNTFYAQTSNPDFTSSVPAMTMPGCVTKLEVGDGHPVDGEKEEGKPLIPLPHQEFFNHNTEEVEKKNKGLSTNSWILIILGIVAVVGICVQSIIMLSSFLPIMYILIGRIARNYKPRFSMSFNMSLIWGFIILVFSSFAYRVGLVIEYSFTFLFQMPINVDFFGLVGAGISATAALFLFLKATKLSNNKAKKYMISATLLLAMMMGFVFNAVYYDEMFPPIKKDGRIIVPVVESRGADRMSEINLWGSNLSNPAGGIKFEEEVKPDPIFYPDTSGLSILERCDSMEKADSLRANKK